MASAERPQRAASSGELPRCAAEDASLWAVVAEVTSAGRRVRSVRFVVSVLGQLQTFRVAEPDEHAEAADWKRLCARGLIRFANGAQIAASGDEVTFQIEGDPSDGGESRITVPQKACLPVLRFVAKEVRAIHAGERQ